MSVCLLCVCASVKSTPSLSGTVRLPSPLEQGPGPWTGESTGGWRQGCKRGLAVLSAVPHLEEEGVEEAEKGGVWGPGQASWHVPLPWVWPGGTAARSLVHFPLRGQPPAEAPRAAGGCQCTRASPSVRRAGDSHGICGEREPQGPDSVASYESRGGGWPHTLQRRSESWDLGLRRAASVPVVGAQDSHPHTRVPYLSGAAVLGPLAAACSAGKPRGPARSFGLRLGAAEQRRTQSSWAGCSAAASLPRPQCSCPPRPHVLKS